MSETVVLKVGMSCKGCVGAVERVLAKMEGVESYNVDIEQQKVMVKGNVQPQVVFEKVSKTGKKTEFWAEELEAKESATTEVPAPAPVPSVETPKEATHAPEEAAPPAPSMEVTPADATAASEAPKEAGVAAA